MVCKATNNTKDHCKDNALQQHKLLEIYTSTPHLQITNKPEKIHEGRIREHDCLLTNAKNEITG